jgi:hypothetical protein
MCQTHGSLNEIAKGAKDSNGVTKCWPGKHAEGTKKGRNGGRVRNCVPNESQGVAEGERTMSRAAKGNEKYGKDGMKALAKAGREGASDEKLDKIRDKYDNYNEEAKHGLYYNVNKRKAAGTSRPASSPKAPTAQAWRDAAKTAKTEGAGAKQAAIAIAKKESGKYTQDGQRKK